MEPISMIIHVRTVEKERSLLRILYEVIPFKFVLSRVLSYFEHLILGLIQSKEAINSSLFIGDMSASEPPFVVIQIRFKDIAGAVIGS